MRPAGEEDSPESALRRPDPAVVRLTDELVAGLRGLVLPHLGTAGARGLAGRASGGDTTFTVDHEAEEFVERFVGGSGVPVAVYSEDRGLVSWGRPEYVLIVDPIDGTRPAAAGFEAACVSVAVASLESGGSDESPAMGDVLYGVIQEIKEGGVFRAVRGECVSMPDGSGRERDVVVSKNGDLSRLFWTIGFRGRPAVELATALGGLIDLSSVDGAVFDIGSATYSMTRILTGQLDAYIDVGPRMIERAPWVEARFRDVGGGHVLNNAPYDVAAAVLILEEAGCLVTDAAGRRLDDRPLLGSGMDHQMSVVASPGGEVHEKILTEIERGMERLAQQGSGGYW